MKTSSPEARLILLSVATSARRQERGTELATLMQGVDWSRLQRILTVRRLLALLGQRIVDDGGDAVPRAFAQAVEAAVADARRHGQFLQLAGARVGDALTAARIVSMPLKGPSLSEALYGDPGYRLSSDIDLLVSPGDLPQAVEAVVALGYRRPSDPVAGDGLPLLHFTIGHEHGRLPDVELHWRVHWYERDFGADMLSRSTVGPGGERVPTPLDGFIALLLFYARDGFIDVRLVADLTAWWELFREDLGPGALALVLDRYPRLRRVLLGALLALERVAHLPGSALLAPAARDLRSSLAARLSNPNPCQSLTQLHADIALVDLLLTPNGAHYEFLRRQILISRDVLEYRAGRAERERVGSPVGHGSRVLVRNALAMPRLLRGPCL